MKFLNMGRRSGKTTMLIHASYLTNTPIIVADNMRAKIIKEQAKDLGLDVEVYSVYEWKKRRVNIHNGGVLIDEAEKIIELALGNYLESNVFACSFSIPMIEGPIKKEADNE